MLERDMRHTLPTGHLQGPVLALCSPGLALKVGCQPEPSPGGVGRTPGPFQHVEGAQGRSMKKTCMRSRERGP